MQHDDIVHGSLRLPTYIKCIIETPQFQRLKGIHQLGLIYKSMPQVNTSRYDHCIGTYFLANKMLDSLEKNTKGLRIPDFYRKVVNIAALLHDVGHGPFSHTWERICCGQYHHEENSVECVDEIFKNYPPEWNEDRAYSIQLIKSIILGDASCLRDQQYRFLFEIVNNKQCKIDVDKWDYLIRDSMHIKDTLHVNMDFDDVFMEARAKPDRTHIEFRYCDYQKIYNIFKARTNFHIHFYQRPYIVCLEKILGHIISASDLDQIDGIQLIDIRSKHVNTFLKLHDAEVWRILKRLKSTDKMARLVECVENGSITQIESVTEEHKLTVPEYLRVDIRIANAGEEMQPKDILFYGDETEKPEFEEKKGFYETISYFKIMDEQKKTD